MAAAALSSRGVVGVRTTKGLFFIVALLSLLCVASSWMDKDQLETHKKNHQRLQEDVRNLKEQMAAQSEFLPEYMSLMRPLTELMKKSSKVFPDVPLEGLLESFKVLEKTSEQKDDADRKLEDIEQKLETMKKFIKFFEENQSEL